MEGITTKELFQGSIMKTWGGLMISVKTLLRKNGPNIEICEGVKQSSSLGKPIKLY